MLQMQWLRRQQQPEDRANVQVHQKTLWPQRADKVRVPNILQAQNCQRLSPVLDHRPDSLVQVSHTPH